jgi:hypothetical protein
MRGSAGSMVRITIQSGDEICIAARQRLACSLYTIASDVGVRRLLSVANLRSLAQSLYFFMRLNFRSLR